MEDDKLSWLEQLSNVIAGQSATGGAKALGTGIGYGLSGGALSDIPDVMREAIEKHKAASAAPKPKSERDALELASALAAISNPVSAAGHAMDFLGAAPSMIEQRLSGEPLPTGEVMQGGLKRRLAKGGAAAEYALGNQLERARQKIEAAGHKITSTNPNDAPGIFQPILRKNLNFPEGEGKFQKIKDYSTSAFDLNKATNPLASEIEPYINYGMGRDNSTVIFGTPHELGVEFSNTVGLNPRYQKQGYGQQIYQNMADFYGGGISHGGSTTKEARKVYDRLGAIDTGIPSGGGTRQALPTREMKADPEALAAFEQKVKEYSANKFGIDPNTGKKDQLIWQIAALNRNERNGLSMDLFRRARENDYWLDKSDILEKLSDFNIRVQGDLPEQIVIGRDVFVRNDETGKYQWRAR